MLPICRKITDFFFLNPSGRSNPFPHPAGEKHVAEDKNLPLPPCALSTYVFKQIFDFFPNVSPKTGFSYSYGWRCLIVPNTCLNTTRNRNPYHKGRREHKNQWVFSRVGQTRFFDLPVSPTRFWQNRYKNRIP